MESPSGGTDGHLRSALWSEARRLWCQWVPAGLAQASSSFHDHRYCSDSLQPISHNDYQRDLSKIPQFRLCTAPIQSPQCLPLKSLDQCLEALQAGPIHFSRSVSISSLTLQTVEFPKSDKLVPTSAMPFLRFFKCCFVRTPIQPSGLSPEVPSLVE